jgi:hypothetical protein
MTVFSTLRNIFKWCFEHKEIGVDERYLSWKHPLFSLLFACSICIFCGVKSSEYFEKKFPQLKVNLNFVMFSKNYLKKIEKNG